MTSIQNQLSASRGLKVHPNSARASPSPSGSHHSSNSVKPRPAPSSQPTSFSTMEENSTGKNLFTQITYAVEYLKSKDRPVAFKDIVDYLSIRDMSEQHELTLRKILNQNEKVEYDPKGLGGKGSYRFKPIHNVRSADELEAYLQRQKTAQGIMVRELKDGWSEAIETVESLEAEGKVLVVRNKKDNTPRMVWADDPSLRHPVDNQFKDLWHKVKLPGQEDVRRELIDMGLTPTSQVKAPVAGGIKKEKKKKAPRRGGKQTNTHMQNILKDFSHLRR